MKKLFSLLLVALLVIAMTTGAFASDASSYVSVSNSAPAIGDTITVNVGISNNPGFTSGKVSLSYDSSVLEIVSMENVMFQGFANPGTAQANHASVSPVTGDGTLCTATFKVIGSGNATVSASISDMYDGDDNAMSVSGASASVSVAAPHEHSWTVNYDETGHWQECACGEKGDVEDHDFVEGVCSVCGYEKPADPEPTEKPDDPEPTKKPVDPEPTKKPVDPNKSPQTGDDSAILLLGGMLTLCAAAVVVLVAARKSKAGK